MVVVVLLNTSMYCSIGLREIPHIYTLQSSPNSDDPKVTFNWSITMLLPQNVLFPGSHLATQWMTLTSNLLFNPHSRMSKVFIFIKKYKAKLNQHKNLL